MASRHPGPSTCSVIRGWTGGTHLLPAVQEGRDEERRRDHHRGAEPQPPRSFRQVRLDPVRRQSRQAKLRQEAAAAGTEEVALLGPNAVRGEDGVDLAFEPEADADQGSAYPGQATSLAAFGRWQPGLRQQLGPE